MIKYKVRPTSKKLVKRANSKQPVRNYNFNAFGSSTLPDYSFEAVDTLVDEDPVADGAIQHFIDKVMEGDYNILKKNDFAYDRALENDLRYNHAWDTKIIRRIAKVGKLYKNVFVEIVRGIDGVTPTDYNVLDSLNIDVQMKTNGDPTLYRSKKPDEGTGNYAEWQPKNIIWLKFDAKDNGWAPVNIKTLYTVLMQKYYINRFVSWAWQTGQYRVVHNFKTTNDDVIQDFVAYNSKSDTDFTQPFLAGGEYVHDLLRDMKEIESLTEYLKYLDNQTVINLRVPPIDAGIPETSGRSNADAQSNNLNTHIKSFKKVVQDGMNELFKKTNRGTNIFVFAPVDKFEEKLIFENVQMLKGAGMTDQALREYMRDKGIVFETKQLFNKPEEMGTKDPEAAPSRQRKPEGSANAKIGTGTQGTTREDQLVKRAFDSYEPSDQWAEY